MEDPKSDDVSRTCLVCSDFTLGNHFGIDACRACAAFFRRSIVEKKKYSCRTGGKCTIDKSIRCLCRKCRLQKCLDAGMQVEGVQGKRDPIIPKHHDPNPLFVPLQTLGSPSEIEASPSTSAFQPVPPRTMLPIVENPELILKTLVNYRKLCSVRHATELALIPQSFKNLFGAGPLAGMSLGTSGNMSLFFRASISPVQTFITETYEDFALLSEAEQRVMFEPFLVYLWWSDCAYRTYKRIPREQFNTICLMSETMYLDVNQSDAWVADMGDQSKSFLKADLSRFLKKEMRPEKQKVLHMMSDMQLQEEEYAALVGLLLWNTTTENSTPNIDEVVKTVRAKIYEELNIYYRNNHINFATRFGELLNLLTNIMVEMLRCKEDLEIFNLLDVFKTDDFFYEMVRNV